MKKPSANQDEMLALPPPDHGSVANTADGDVAGTPTGADAEALGANAAGVPTPKAKAQAKKKGKAKAKSAASTKKAPGVTTSPKKKAAKAKAKSALKNVLKKPAAAPSVAPKSKPKAKAKTVQEMAAAWQRKRLTPEDDGHAEGEEEEPREEDTVVENEEHRSYPKARKWARMIKSGQVPEDLQQLYEDGAKNSPTPRLFKSQFINKIFQVNSKGEYVLAPGNPAFETFKRNTETRSSKTAVTGYPWSIMLWKYFQGNEQAMGDAERRGDIFQKEGYYHFKTVASAVEKKVDSSMTLHGGQTNLNKDEYSQMSQFMSTRPWAQFGSGGSSSSVPQAGITSSKAPPKAILDAPVKVTWASVEEDIKEARGAQERLQRDCQRLAAKVFDKKDQDMNETLKKILTQLSKTESMLGQCLIFQTVEGTNMEKGKVEAFFAELGKATGEANERLESTKSIAKTRGWLDK
eukprot:s3256_g19.t1